MKASIPPLITSYDFALTAGQNNLAAVSQLQITTPNNTGRKYNSTIQIPWANTFKEVIFQSGRRKELNPKLLQSMTGEQEPTVDNYIIGNTLFSRTGKNWWNRVSFHKDRCWGICFVITDLNI